MIDAEPDKVPMGYSIVVARHGTVFLADTAINETPTPEQLADDRQADGRATPAPWATSRASPSLSFSNFGSREIERIDRIRKAIRLLDAREGRLRV